MTKLEIACVICGLLAFLCPLTLNVTPPMTFTDVLVVLAVIIRYIVCGLMILLPLYFRFWRRKGE